MDNNRPQFEFNSYSSSIQARLKTQLILGQLRKMKEQKIL